MGGSISRVSCGDISIHQKKGYKARRHHTVRIDKTKIGIPTDFRHTYHVGNGSPVMDEFADNLSSHKSASIVSESEFMATMAQITNALQKLPLHTFGSPHQVATKKLGTSVSDQHIPQRSFSVLNHQRKKPYKIEMSNSLLIGPLAAEFSQKERHVLQMRAASVVSETSTLSSSPATPHSTGMTTSELTGGYYDFSSCLQSKIDAQIVELARARSKGANSMGSRSPRNNLMLNNPTIMI